MAIQQLSDEQVRTWSRDQKDRWWLENVYRGDMAQLTLRSGATGFLLGGVLSATALYIAAKTGVTIGVGLTSVILAFAMYRIMNSAVGPDNGFFRPTPGNDPSLTNPPPVKPPAPPAPGPFPQPAPALTTQVVVPVPAAVMPNPVEAAEVQLDRSQREAEEAAARRSATAPQPVAGSFTGLTNERDR